jgi:hypothetical protein
MRQYLDRLVVQDKQESILAVTYSHMSYIVKKHKDKNLEKLIKSVMKHKKQKNIIMIEIRIVAI